MAGAAFLPVTRKGETATLNSMGQQAIAAALSDANVEAARVDLLVVGNMMSGMLSDQQHLGPLLANAAGLSQAEAFTVEACCGAGGAALRCGYMAIRSGEASVVVVAGVEQMTHRDRDQVTHALATASHWPSEGAKGETFVSLNGILMKEYMARYNVPHSAFAPFAITAHRHATLSQHAVFKNKPLDLQTFESAAMVTPPIQLFDASPTCDGAAAVVLVADHAHGSQKRPGVRIVASASAVDQLAVAARPDPLHLAAVKRSTELALAQAKLARSDVDIFELHDAYTIMAALSLENAGFVSPGEALAFAADGQIGLGGKVPMATFGGLKARGHPVGATGVYQAAEMYAQLVGRAGKNQVADAEIAMIQNIGGSGASVFTHILARC